MASLLGWLGKRIEGAAAQANPFDNGATYNTTLNNQPTNLQRAQNTINDANQQAQNARYGVLANPAYRANTFIPSQTQGNSFNPLSFALNNIKNTVEPFVKPLGIGPEDARLITALATHNQPAAQAANQRARSDLNAAAQYAQFTPRALVQVGQSVNPFGHPTEHQLTAKNRLGQAILGNQPIPSLERVYKQTQQESGTPLAIANTAATTAADLLALGGAGKTIEKGLGNRLPLNESGAVGKNVESPALPSGDTPKTPLTPEGVPTKAAGKGTIQLSASEIADLKKQGFDDATISKMGGPQGEKLVAPEAPRAEAPKTKAPPRPQGNIIPQISSEGKVTRLTSLANRLDNLGQGGKDALQTIRNKEIGARVHTQQLADIAKPFLDLSPEEQASAIKVHKGEFTTADPKVQAGADSLKAMFKEAHQRAVNAKIKVGNQGENYFPQSYPREWFKDPKSINKAAQQLVANGQAPDLETAIGKLNKIKIENSVNPSTYGHFRPRTTDIPGIENSHTVTNYIRGASDAIAQAEHFGPKNTVLKGHIATAIRNGEDATALRDIISNYTHPNQPGLGTLSKGLNLYQKGLRVLQLPRAAISHAPQGLANTASDIGYGEYAKALGQRVKISSADESFLNNNGFRAEGIAPPEGLTGKATAPGLGPMLQFHRDVAALGGRNIALGLAKNGDIAALKELGIDGKLVKDASGEIKLTEAQQAQAGHFEANKSIGSSSRLESPSWTQTQGGKLVSMYRKMYTFKQAERIGGWMKEAKNGNPEPLIKYLAVAAPITGATVALAKDEIKNPFSNPLKDPKKLALDTLHNSGIGSIGYGLLDSGINALSHNYGNDSRWSNAANAVTPAAGFAVQTGQHIAKGIHGNWKPLERQGLQSLPVGGNYLANKLVPPTSYQPDVNKQLAAKNNTQTETDFRNNPPKGYSLQQVVNKDGINTYAYTLSDGSIGTNKSLQKARNAIAKDAFGNSDSNIKVVGNQVLRKSADGTVSVMSKDKYDYSLGNAQLTNYKKTDNLQGWFNTAGSQLKLIQKQLQDPNVDPLDKLTLQNEAQTLTDNMAKYKEYGAFTKGKSGASMASARVAALKGIGSFKTASRSKISAPKGIKVSSPRAPKLASTRKLSVSKIPSNYLSKKRYA